MDKNNYFTKGSSENLPCLSKQQQLSLAITIATQAHSASIKSGIGNSYEVSLGNFDKGGRPYILHPIHLMTQLLFDTQLATIAVLHDVIEDSSFTIDILEKLGLSSRVCIAVDLLTHRADDEYLTEYIFKISKNYDSIMVKMKDLEHNSCITRLKSKQITQRDEDRIKKYHTAFLFLEEAKKTFERRV